MKKIILISVAVLLALSLTACEKAVEEETTEEAVELTTEDPATKELRGMLYAVTAEETKTNEFMCVGGEITPERIAAGFTGWTGINFGVTSVKDETTKTITVTWKNTSAAVTKKLVANEGFEFTSYEEMKTFMETSLAESIVKNMGDYTVVFE